MKRRTFIKKSGLATVYISTGAFKFSDIPLHKLTKLTILHTNDVHSRIDPFPMDGGKYQGLGGAAARAAVIDKIRQNESAVILLGAGDIFQGTPYFNEFKGEIEFKLMSKMNYDAATIGNHDFDLGIKGLHKQLPHANFDFINCNYNLKDTILHDKVSLYKIYKKGDVKIGVLGVGIELQGLVPKNLYGDTQYLDPIVSANKIAELLRKEKNCNYVICLSHLGYSYRGNKISDKDLAAQTSNIDLIIGGHTHTFLKNAETKLNAEGKEVLISQVGWGGINLGHIEVVFEKNFKSKCTLCKNTLIKN